MFHVEHQINQSQFFEIFVEGAEQLGFGFSKKILEMFYLYYAELCQWGKLVNLTSLKDEREKIVLLFLDSLAGSLAFEEIFHLDIVDIGTGGGFPGIPLKIAFPEINLTLVEARSKKTAFLINVIGKLNLSNSKVIQGRIEDLTCTKSPREKWHLAMIKGVNVFHVIPGLKNILQKNGKLAVFRSKNFDNPGIINGMEIYKEIPYELPFGFGRRVLSILRVCQE